MMSRLPLQAKIERTAYGVGAACLAALPQLDDGGVNASVAVLGGGCAWWLYRRATRSDFRTALVAAQRGLPVLTGAAAYAAAVTADGARWWEYAAPVAWGALMAVWLPVTRASWTPSSTALAPAAPSGFAEQTAAKWAASQAAQQTRLTDVERLHPTGKDFTAVVVAPAGLPVPRLDLDAVAAVFDVPTSAVHGLEDMLGSGPGRKRLTITPSDRSGGQTFEDHWRERVGGHDGAIPGSRVTKVVEHPGRVMILAEVPSGQVATINHAQLCSAFGVKAAELRLIAETDGGSKALVTLYETSPLTSTRAATRELLTPDADGYWVIGTAHDGTDVYARLWDPKLGALHGYVVGVTGSGKTVAFVLGLAAVANAGGVSWLASLDPDAQLAAAGKYIDRQGSGRTYAARATRAAVALMTIRGEINAEVGHDFSAASPYPLLVLDLDEFNGLCDDSDEGQEIAANSVAIAERGRKYGMAVKFGGQTLDLSRIGGDRSLREQTRSGTGVVLRTVSGISGRQATEGMLPEGVELADIPIAIGGGLSIEDRMEGITEVPHGASTAGMGHVLTGSAPRMMRILYAHLPKDGTGHNLDDLFPEGGGVFTLTAREVEALDALDLYGDWTAPVTEAETAAAQQAAAKPKRVTAKDRILAVLTGEMTAKEIREALPDIAAGTVRNALSAAVEEGLISNPEHGVYAPLN
ncbi:hypothetical protein [Streptomyces chryseus]|uniref:Chromosome segregation protein ParM n=1 Tax=Streptomyces chryseus TaxID=68186 RepID=A0ABQ3DD64_9ACTN|nr:hypothetical protein [Streptomyces chryseus]GHA83153.1 chromosome segregation protein ParM [Streptomyces chryseus]